MIYSILFVVVLTRVILEVVVRLRSTTRQIKQQKEGKRKMRLMVVLGSGAWMSYGVEGLQHVMLLVFVNHRWPLLALTDGLGPSPLSSASSPERRV